MDNNDSDEGSPKTPGRILGRSTYQTRSVTKRTAGDLINNSPKNSPGKLNESSRNEYSHNSSGSNDELSDNEFVESNIVEEPEAPFWNSYICIAIIIAMGFITSNFLATTDTNTSDLDLIKLFPSKDPNFWLNVNVGINEVNKFHKPSVIIFLYNNSEEYIDNFIKNLSEVASKQIGNGAGSPTIITEKDFNSREAISDYGYNIEKYKPLLESGYVLALKHLDMVEPHVAKALHTLCDDISPLVKKSLFLFTIKVENKLFETKNTSRLVMEVLKKKWSVLSDDVFEPLFARISNIILKVTPNT